MDTINVKGYGNLKVPDDFRTWDSNRQQSLISKAVKSKEAATSAASPATEPTTQPQTNEPVDTTEESVGIIGDIIVSGGPSGYIGGKSPSPITTGEEDIPDWELPNVPLNYLKGAWNAVKGIATHGDAAIESTLRPFAEGIVSSLGIDSYASEKGLQEGEYVTEEEYNSLKDKSDRWLLNNELERTDDGWIRRRPESGLHKAGELAGAGYALIGGGQKAGLGVKGLSDVARKFHKGEIREFGEFKDEFLKMVSRNKDEIDKAAGKPKISTFKGAPRRFTPDEIKMVGTNLGRSPFKSVNSLTGIGKKLGDNAAKAAKEIGSRLKNFAKTETKATTADVGYRIGGTAAAIATEFYVAAEIAENVLNEYAPEGLTDAEKKKVGQWYGANYIFTSTFSKMWKNVGVSNKLANLLIAEATSLSLVLAGLDPKDRQSIQSATTNWLRDTVEGLKESGKLSEEDLKWTNEFLGANLFDVSHQGPGGKLGVGSGRELGSQGRAEAGHEYSSLDQLADEKARGFNRGGQIMSPRTQFYLNSGGKVGNKIKLLMAEGKPQDQAVAIALDYKRRGKL